MQSWPAPPPDPMPLPGEVSAVFADLAVTPGRLCQLTAGFTQRERQRAESFATDEWRDRWSAARGTLREVLGHALRIAPEAVALRYRRHGKPELDPDCAPLAGELRFNLSHSGERALIALARVEVGADVERLKPRRTDDIARRFFVPGEQRRLFSLSPVEREQAFFRLWTCKEAFLKVTGEGLSRSTRSYEVEVGPDGARLLWATGIHDAAERFSVYPLDPGNGYAAALFAEARGLTLRRFHWP
ncbi:MAG TPA: 4'-phosphopantetheinyl transferase superfamily protein [Myxococcales bacterium]|nr:4'-phosphopantetheinyl transferase superfamily protein [Myxococcales bacterium]